LGIACSRAFKMARVVSSAGSIVSRMETGIFTWKKPT
jgi:hypothetical protein